MWARTALLFLTITTPALAQDTLPYVPYHDSSPNAGEQWRQSQALEGIENQLQRQNQILQQQQQQDWITNQQNRNDEQRDQLWDRWWPRQP